MWQRAVKYWAAKGEIAVLGVVQEQHPDRARLYKQWREFDWPILVDSLNLLDFKVVPIPMLVDEVGMIRRVGRIGSQAIEIFVMTAQPEVELEPGFNVQPMPELAKERKALKESDAAAWLRYGDSCFLLGNMTAAIDAYEHAAQGGADAGRSAFRLGVALRRRFESPKGRSTDAQRAVQAWGTALAADPSQYIWRRRLQQARRRQTCVVVFWGLANFCAVG